MSTFLYIVDEMGYKERGSYMDLIVTVGVAAKYVWDIYRLQLLTPLTGVAFQGPMVRAILLSVVATIILHIIYAILTGSKDTKEDQRDRQVSRFGDWISLFPLASGAFAGLILAMYGAHHFWIANAIYAGFFISAITGNIARIIVYRRGLMVT